MSNTDFSIEGWEQFVEQFGKLADNWEAKKRVLLGRIGGIMDEEINPLIPVDTSNLASKFSVQIDGDTVGYTTNVRYAIYVNDGHVQHARFVPIDKLTVKGRRYVPAGGKGIFLTESYVQGTHYIERGMQNAQPHIERLTNSFMEQIWREVEGGRL